MKVIWRNAACVWEHEVSGSECESPPQQHLSLCLGSCHSSIDKNGSGVCNLPTLARSVSTRSKRQQGEGYVKGDNVRGQWWNPLPFNNWWITENSWTDLWTSLSTLKPQEKLDFGLRKEVDGMGVPDIKYGDSVCYIQHADTGLWLTYQSVDAKCARMGGVQRKVSGSSTWLVDDLF